MDKMENPEIFKGKYFEDKRGVFAPLQLTYDEGVLNKKWIQSNISYNPKPYTLRGLHFQIGEYSQSKLIKVISGKIIDFVVDIRPTSPDYLKVYKYEMMDGDELFVPKGFAHGFITLGFDVIVQYLVDNIYSPENEGSIFWKSFPEIVEEISKYTEEKLIVISNKDLLTKNFI
jgi:dTDP-4-dehydrorhamnose 3,5-epimerase